MKIAFFTDTYYPQINGVTIALDYLTKQLKKEGHQVYIFAPKMKKYNDSQKDVIRLPAIKVLSSEPEVLMPTLLSAKNLKLILSTDMEIIHAHGNGFFSLLGIQIAKLKGIPYVLTFHSLHTEYTHYIFKGRIVKPRMVATAFRVFGNWCDGVITPSKKMKEKLRTFGLKKDIRVIPNFIDIKRFDVKDKLYLRKKLGLSKDDTIFLSVGRLGKEKNFEFLIKVFKKISQKEKTAHLAIVGHGVEEKSLKKLVADLDLKSQVHLTGKIDPSDMPFVYKDADVFLFASKSEVHPIVALEAAAAGLPLIVVNDGAFEDVAVNNVNAYVLPLNKELFEQKILNLCKDKEKRIQMAKQSLAIAKEICRPEKLSGELIHYYNEIIDNYQPKNEIIRKISKGTWKRINKSTQLLSSVFNFSSD